MPDMPSEIENTSIGQDIACLHCAYNLRGLSPHGRCPECGAAVWPSLRGDLLRYADGRWLKRLAFGVLLVQCAIALNLVFASLFMIVGPFPYTASPSNLYLPLVGSLVGFWGAVVLTAKEPLALGRDPWALRWAIRVCAGFAIAAMLLPLIFAGRLQDKTLALVVPVCDLVGWSAYLGELVYLSRLAHRIPDRTLARDACRLLWVLTSALTVNLLCKDIVARARAEQNVRSLGGPDAARQWLARRRAYWTPLRKCVLTLGYVGMVVLALGMFWYLMLLVRYRAALIAAAAHDSDLA